MASQRNGYLGPRQNGGVGRLRLFLRLLYPGVGLKRWALVGALGVAICSIGAAYLLRKFFALPFPDFLPWYFEGFLMLAVGGGSILLSMYGFYKALSPFFREPQSIETVADNVYNRWARARGPKVVAIGGGTGQSTLLRGLKYHTDNLTAIITVADDGGSSGRLRREFGVLPPGDIRNCLVAMSEDDSLLADLFQYRFDEGDGLRGHSFGNLFIVAMSKVTDSFDQALVESSGVLAVRGQVVPSTPDAIQLAARFTDGQVVRGESNIRERGGRIERLAIEPATAAAHALAIQAIESADIVLIGPGSLYTSIIPNLLVRGISESLRRTDATVVYICNVATEQGETHGFSIRQHLDALEAHTYTGIADYVLANVRPLPSSGYAGITPVAHDGRPLETAGLVFADMVDDSAPARHESSRLAEAVIGITQTGNGQRSGSSIESLRIG